MPTAIRSVTDRLKGFWNAFSVPQRTLTLVAVIGVVVGAVALAGWLSKPTMSAVYSGLSDSDASAVVAQLDAQGVDYELAAGGSTVLVPADQVDKVRLELAANGLPAQSDGYALLDKMGVGASEFQQQVTYQRAVEGELAKTISSIDGVASATVHLAIPEQSVYTDQQEDPTASVFVALKPGATFGGDNVRAVTNLVSASVPNLSASDVSVVDDQGRDLTLAATDVTGATTDRDTAVAAKVQDMLDRVVGSGKSAVTVVTDVDADTTQRTTETYSSTDGVPPLSSSTKTETYTGSGAAAGGVLGTDNIAVPSDTSGNGMYSSEDSTVNNSVNKVTEQTTTPPGSVRRQSVSVVVDRQSTAGMSDSALKAMVSAAAGIDEERGDTLSVVKADFDTSTAQAATDALAQQQADAAARHKEQLLAAEIGGAILLLVLLAALLVMRSRRRRRARERAAAQEERDQERRFLTEDELAQRLRAAQEQDEDEDDLVRTSVMPARPDPDEQMRSDIVHLADEDPQAVASALQEWLAVHR